jgi:cobalt/nickel transport system permease protein
MKFLIGSPRAVFGRKEEQGQASYTFVDSVTPLRYDEGVFLPICSLLGSGRSAAPFLKDADEAKNAGLPEEIMMLPPWFRENGSLAYHPDPALANRRMRLPFLDRTLRAVADLMQDFLFAEIHAQKSGLLQKLDPRVKLITLLLYVVAISLLHSLPWILALYGVSLGLALFSQIPLGFFLRRVWLVLPLFAGIIALPATLNLFTPGDPAVFLFSLNREYQWGPYRIPAEITLTRQGIQVALLLVSRVGVSLSFILLLTLTTPWADLFKAFRSLRIPVIYVQTLGMTLRYLMLLGQIVRDMHLAKKSRTLRPLETRTEQSWIAGQMATLFKRSLQLSGDVHRAMVARGYQGDVRILSVFHLRPADGLWSGVCAVLITFFLWGGR